MNFHHSLSVATQSTTQKKTFSTHRFDSCFFKFGEEKFNGNIHLQSHDPDVFIFSDGYT